MADNLGLRFEDLMALNRVEGGYTPEQREKMIARRALLDEQPVARQGVGALPGKNPDPATQAEGIAQVQASIAADEKAAAPFGGITDPGTQRGMEAPGNPLTDPQGAAFQAASHPEAAQAMQDRMAAVFGATRGTGNPEIGAAEAATLYSGGSLPDPHGERMPYNGASPVLQGVDVLRSSIRREAGGTAPDGPGPSFSNQADAIGVPYRPETHPVTGRQIVQNPDGSVSTERSITVETDALNGGKPTNIPSMWDGKQVDPKEAIRRAVESGTAYPAFASNAEAETAAVARSKMLGDTLPKAGRPDYAGMIAKEPNPAKRAALRTLAMNQEHIDYGEKSASVVGREVAANLPQAIADARSKGDDATTQDLLDRVQGKPGTKPLSYVAAEKLIAGMKEAASYKAEADYATLQEQFFNLARGQGVAAAKDEVLKGAQEGRYTPTEVNRLNTVLTHRGRSVDSPDAIASPDTFLPIDAHAAAIWEKRMTNTGLGVAPSPVPEHMDFPPGTDTVRPRRVYVAPGQLDMPDQAASPLNPGGQAPSREDAMAQRKDQAQQDLLDTVTGPDQVGKPAKTVDSYLERFLDAGPSAGELAGYGKGGWGALTGAGGAIGEALAGITAAAGGHESTTERKRRLEREAAKRARS